MAAHEREQFFGAGVTLGILVGFVLGSLVAMRLGESVVEGLSHLMERVAGRRERINFELLLQ
jgi:hypothetical protein